MSVGKSLLKAIIEQEDVGALRDLTPALFGDKELEHYEFIEGYYRKYRKLPGLDVLNDHGLAFGRTETTGTIAHYMDRLHDRAMWQDLSPLMHDLQQAMIKRDMVHATQVIQKMAAKGRDRDSSQLMVNIGRVAQDLLNDMRKKGDFMLSIPSGWPILDIATGGFNESDFFVLAGRTNIGKSYFLLFMVMAAWKAMFRPLVITMEMGVKPLTTRMVGMGSGINTKFIRERTVGTRAMRSLVETVTDFQLRPPLTFVSGHKLKGVEQIESLIEETQPDITFVDAAYLLKLANAGNNRASKFEILEQVMEYLQGIVVRTKRPLAITVQLGRGQSSKSSNLDGAIDKIRGSDSIAQLGSVVVTSAPAEGVWAQTRRIHRLSKNREGVKEIEWWSKFEFTPRMDFSQTPAEAKERRANNINRML